jgi:ABC-2 type transport system permease protein
MAEADTAPVRRPGATAGLGPRPIGRVNWIGVKTLYLKEVRRFLKVVTQTVAAPMVTTLLFLSVFFLAVGSRGGPVGGVPYLEFLAPGLIIMAVAQNAFANTSSSVVIGKVQGNIIDLLMPPLSPGEITSALMLGGITRGLLVGASTAFAMWLIVPLRLPHPLFALYHGLAAASMLALLGVLGGIWADKFDHLSAVTNFVVTPLAFLSGTFYSVERLPPVWLAVAHGNPFFYMIDGFRYGFIDHADGNLEAGLAVLLLVNVGLWLLTAHLFRIGYKLKA